MRVALRDFLCLFGQDAGQHDASLGLGQVSDASVQEASVPPQDVPDTGVVADTGSDTGPIDAGTDPTGTVDDRVLGTWSYTDGSVQNYLTFYQDGNAPDGTYSFTHFRLYTGTGHEQEDTGSLGVLNGVLTFTTNASSCEPDESQPAPYSNGYLVSADGKTLYLDQGDLTIALPAAQYDDDEGYLPGCSEVDGGWVQQNVSPFRA